MLDIYSDGASRGNPGLGAWGFMIIDSKNQKHCSSGCQENVTNNRMEALAIKNALDFCVKNNWVSEEINFYCDSAWAIGAISKNWSITMNRDIVMGARMLLKQFNNIKFIKVRGHSDCSGNNEVDRMLNDAMDDYLCEHL